MKIRLHVVATLLLISTYGFGQIITYEFSDSYDTDPSFINLNTEFREIMNSINELRDTVISCKEINQEQKLESEQMINALQTNRYFLTNLFLDKELNFPIFKLIAPDSLHSLFTRHNSNITTRKAIEETYKNRKGDVRIKSIERNKHKDLKKIITKLGVYKTEEKKSIFLSNESFTNKYLDRLFRNKEIYFPSERNPHRTINLFRWSSLYKAYHCFTKNSNTYQYVFFNICDPIDIEEKFDYVIINQKGSDLSILENSETLLTQKGKVYIKLRITSEDDFKKKDLSEQWFGNKGR